MSFLYYLREAELLTYAELRCFEASKVGRGFIRKGARRYADRLLRDIERRNISVDHKRILVIGDGESDYLFFRQAEAYTNESQNSSVVEGLFVRNSELASFEGKSGHLNFFDSWNDLCSALHARLSSGDSSLVFVDIDRTLIYPRGEFDDPYAEFKANALRHYVSSFAKSDEAVEETLNIQSVAAWVEESFSCYRNDGDVVCYSNYEVLAFVSSLVLSGLLPRGWIGRQGDKFLDAAKLFAKSKKLLRIASWPCRIKGVREEGNRHWDVQKFSHALDAAISAVSERQPDLSPQFRRIEFEVMSQNRDRNDGSFLNAPLMDLLAQSQNASTVVFSDRPISTVWDGEVFLLE